MAWEENSRICLHMQLIAILSRIGVNLLLLSHMCLYDRITLMYFPKLRFNTLCDISVFITIQLVFVLVASICRNRMIKNKQKQKDV